MFSRVVEAALLIWFGALKAPLGWVSRRDGSWGPNRAGNEGAVGWKESSHAWAEMYQR
jgi:hypothetical protein